MGKSGGRRKKGGASASPTRAAAAAATTTTTTTTTHVSAETPSPVPTPVPKSNGGVDYESAVFLKRAHELKDEGNKRFQSKDYGGALELYDNALRLIPKTHPDRAALHSNRAACLLQMNPIDYDSVIAECTVALQVQPRFVRALLRRSRAFEAMGKYEMAMQDVELLLLSDPNHQDALEIAQRLRVALRPRQEAQQDLPSRPSPAALGASAVRGAPVAGLGASLLTRPVPKKAAAAASAGGGSVAVANNKQEKTQSILASENGPDTKPPFPQLVLKPSDGSSKSRPNPTNNDHKEPSFPSSPAPLTRFGKALPTVIRYRPLKLVYDHDIRLAQMPVSCSFRELREIVGKRFLSAKSVLIKYKDNDGDLVTITCTTELRMAESSVDSLLSKPKEGGIDQPESVAMLRLHIVEVNPEQEPPLLEEEEEEKKPVESEATKGDESASHSSLPYSAIETMNTETCKEAEEVLKEKSNSVEDSKGKEMEMDDWLFEFAQLFRAHVGIDPDAHLDLHEIGMEHCSEALEETVTSEEAQILFDEAAVKFQEVAALAFFNWGNVHMCAARKRIPLDESAGKEVMTAQLQDVYDWVKEKYALACEKYKEGLLIKPDFYEGLLALGQQQFEMAKLHWSFALAKKIDFSTWDSTETIKLFDSAEEKMKAATEMWEKLEQQRAKELKDPAASSKREELLKRRKKQGVAPDGESLGVDGRWEISPDEAAEQAAVMRSQIHLFWGNMLFERSQVEFKLGRDGWKRNLDAAVERFKLAGASEVDVATAMKSHFSMAGEAAGEEKKNGGQDAVAVSCVPDHKNEADQV